MKKYYAVMFEDSSVADVIASSREEALEVAMAAPGAPGCMAIQATAVGFVPPKMRDYSTYDGWERMQQFSFKSSDVSLSEVHIWIPVTHVKTSTVYVEAYGFEQPGELSIYGAKAEAVLQKDGLLGVYAHKCAYQEFLKGAIDTKAPVKFTGADGSITHFHMEE
jgi:hypothetical protein